MQNNNQNMGNNQQQNNMNAQQMNQNNGNNGQQVPMGNNPYINNQTNNLQNEMIQGNPYVNNQVNQNNGFNNTDFIKGAVIGAGITFLLTNKTSQTAIFNGFAKISDMFNVGMEEIKERIEDAKAQMESQES